MPSLVGAKVFLGPHIIRFGTPLGFTMLCLVNAHATLGSHSFLLLMDANVLLTPRNAWEYPGTSARVLGMRFYVLMDKLTCATPLAESVASQKQVRFVFARA
jgi:hypothetical protein